MKKIPEIFSGLSRQTLGWVLFFACLCIVCFQLVLYHYRLVTYPYSLELRESSVLFTTDLLLKNINPYNLEQMPLAINVYGIVYHLLVYPFAKIWGPTFVVHRTIAGIAIILSCAFIILFLKKSGVRWAYSCSSGVLLYIVWLFFVTPIARPDGKGKQFDIVYAGNLFHHVNIESTLKQIVPVVKPDGVLVSWDPVAYNPLINIYRLLARNVRTPDEHPLKLKDINMFQRYFHHADVRYFWLTTLIIFILMFVFQRKNPNKERFWKVVITEGDTWA